MKKVAIYRGARPSQGATNLRDRLRERGVEWCNILRPEGSAFTGGPNSLVINWGTYNDEAYRLSGIAQAYNHPASVRQASNKLLCLRKLAEEQHVPTIPWYERLGDALNHIGDGRGRIYARTTLNGHSGEGIVVLLSKDDPQVRRNPALLGNPQLGRIATQIVDNGDPIPPGLARASLFTIGHVGRRVEYRVHVFGGEAILFQKKVRRQGEVEADDANTLVRNIHTGWVYSVNIEIPQLIKDKLSQVALLGCDRLGLDFGAVDLIWPEGSEDPLILEVNTAPGLEGETTLDAYCDAIIKVANQ